jgi:hypothetical protein
VHADRLGRLDEVTIGGLASLLERRLVEAPSAWHFWHLWPCFAPQPR